MEKTKILYYFYGRDTVWQEELDKHLALVKRGKVVETWTKSSIPAGADVDVTFRDWLKQSIVVMPISVHTLSHLCPDGKTSTDLATMVRLYNRGTTAEDSPVFLFVPTATAEIEDLPKELVRIAPIRFKLDNERLSRDPSERDEQWPYVIKAVKPHLRDK
jgi:hypothetical protein